MTIHICDRCKVQTTGGIAVWDVTLGQTDAVDPAADKALVLSGFAITVQVTAHADLCPTCFQSALKVASSQLPSVNPS